MTFPGKISAFIGSALLDSAAPRELNSAASLEITQLKLLSGSLVVSKSSKLNSSTSSKK
jgi:hypothetical protein